MAENRQCGAAPALPCPGPALPLVGWEGVVKGVGVSSSSSSSSHIGRRRSVGVSVGSSWWVGAAPAQLVPQL